MENYIYCIREQALCENECVYFKIGHANDLDRRKSSMQTANPRPLRVVFVLGPFLNRDEAEDVESQAHKLLAKHHVRGEWFDTNPLSVSEFWAWIDSQILPICVHEKAAVPWRPARSRPRFGRRESKWQRAHGDLYCRKEPIQGSLDLG